MNNNFLKKLTLLTILWSILSGCSVYMAANQPEEKSIELFRVGTDRAMLVGVFGTPINSEIHNGQKHDIFKFVQGYSPGIKAARSFFHGAADVLTFTIWEVAGTPIEGYYNGDNMAFEVRYDQDNRIDMVVPLHIVK